VLVPALDPLPTLLLDPLLEGEALLPDKEPPLPAAPDEELPIPDDELPVPGDDELPMPEDEELPAPELATSTPSALAVLSSMRPVACRLLDFWNSRIACCVFGPRTPSSGPGSIPLLLSADWTSLTLSFDMRPLAEARRLDPILLL